MKATFRKSFGKDLTRHAKDKDLMAKIKEIILQVEASDSVAAIANLKKLKAEGSYFRIRVGHFRVGLIIEDDTVSFVRALHRKEIYRYFP